MQSEKADKPWILKHLPKTTKDVIGQDNAVKELKEFVSNYKKQKRKAMFLYGPPGCGKTVAAYAVAHELGLEIIEMNASDFRTADQIKQIIGGAAQQMSLFAKGKLILVDEVGGISGTKDRGGIPEILRIMETSSFPIIMTGEDPYDQKLSGIRKKCELINFDSLDYTSIFKILKKIADKEGIKYEDEQLNALARRAGGDSRAAINDLQMLSAGTKKISKEDLEELSQREQRQTILDALLKIFKTTDIHVAITALDNVNEDFNEVMLWLDENLPKEYEKPQDLANAYDYISKADRMNRRIRRWQHWRFLVYVNAYLTAGVALAKKEKNKNFIQYKPTMRILKIWQAKMKYQKRLEIAQKIAEKTHTSKRRVIQDVLPYVKVMMQKNKELREALAHKFDLNNDEVNWLREH